MKCFRALVVLAVVLVGAKVVSAVAKVHPSGIAVQKPDGSPLGQATISLTFNDTTMTAKSDDDGVVGILLFPGDGGRRSGLQDGKLVLVGDGTGAILYDGAPNGGDPFTVRAGTLTLNTPGGSRVGKSNKKKYLIGGGAAGAVLIGVAVAGGGGSSAATATPTRTPGAGATPTPTPATATGSWNCGFVVKTNPGAHPNNLPGTFLLDVDQNGQLINVGSAESNFIPVSGPLSGNTLNALGGGVYAGFPTQATLTNGTFAGNFTTLNGDYAAGTDGGLPGGQPITWSVVCNKQ